MKRATARKAVIPITEQPTTPKARGFAVREARADIGAWFELTISTCSPWNDDPIVVIELDRRHGAAVVGEAKQKYADFIEDFRASDLDSLVEALQAAIAVGRQHGVIPPSNDLPAWREAHRKMDARDAKQG